jgi:hypothetical protein
MDVDEEGPAVVADAVVVAIDVPQPLVTVDADDADEVDEDDENDAVGSGWPGWAGCDGCISWSSSWWTSSVAAVWDVASVFSFKIIN